ALSSWARRSPLCNLWMPTGIECRLKSHIVQPRLFLSYAQPLVRRTTIRRSPGAALIRVPVNSTAAAVLARRAGANEESLALNRWVLGLLFKTLKHQTYSSIVLSPLVVPPIR